MFFQIWLSVAIILIKDSVAVNFNIRNKDGGDIWIGILANSGKPNLNNGGFVLHSGQSITVGAPNDWAGRFWARTWCNPGNNHCDTGDCGNRLECNGAGGAPPATLVEITLNGYGGLDYYDISLVDGFNTKARIEPVGGQGDGGQYSCKPSACTADVNNGCPGDLQVRNGNGIIGCKSDCVAYNTDQACCRGAFGTPQTCPRPNSANYFKGRCRDAYSYAYDDQTSTFTCKAQTYNIEFGG